MNGWVDPRKIANALKHPIEEVIMWRDANYYKYTGRMVPQATHKDPRRRKRDRTRGLTASPPNPFEAALQGCRRDQAD